MPDNVFPFRPNNPETPASASGGAPAVAAQHSPRKTPKVNLEQGTIDDNHGPRGRRLSDTSGLGARPAAKRHLLERRPNKPAPKPRAASC